MYLYKEINNRLRDTKIKNILILDEKNQLINRFAKKILYIIQPDYIKNKEMHKRLFRHGWYYIIPGSFHITKINFNSYIHILNIGNKYKVYILFNKYTDNKDLLKYVYNILCLFIADDVVINKVTNIKEGLEMLDLALEFGKDIYAIPGDIFERENYLANFALKHGAIPICGIYDIRNILLEKKVNVL